MRKNYIIPSVAVLGSVFLFLWQQVQATRLGYVVGQTRAALHQQQEHNAYLRLELAHLQAPERIAKDAHGRLGMSAPNPESLVFLGERKIEKDEPKLLSFLIRRQ